MSRLLSILFISILMLFIFPSTTLAPGRTATATDVFFDQVFADLVADYALYTSLLQDVYPLKQHNISLHVNSPDAATAYLDEGFALPLAQAIVDCYVQWLPEYGKAAIIPADSIPIITAADKPYLKMRRTSPDEVVLERIYINCYEIGDRYLYKITVRPQQLRWIVVDLQLDRVDPPDTL
ncbi:MAG: hypothetical protein PHQ94_06535 [Syntrophomonas sp.]|nr:hypothetical protein [Syntrophomonas sp.]